MVLSQPNSKYELSGEYILPPGFELPRSVTQMQPEAPPVAAAAAGTQGHHQQQQQQRHGISSSSQDHQQQQQEEQQVTAEGGRWRLQLVVPQAAVEELLPAGQLLRQAGRRSAGNYSLAKSRFLTGLAGAAISAGQEFSSQVREGDIPLCDVLYVSICLLLCTVCLWQWVMQMTRGSSQ
jgi:hypothetical protein